MSSRLSRLDTLPRTSKGRSATEHVAPNEPAFLRVLRNFDAKTALWQAMKPANVGRPLTARSSEARPGTATSYYRLALPPEEEKPVEREVPSQSVASAHFRVIQKWEGFIEQTKRRTFVARLVDLTGDLPDQRAEILRTEVPSRDRQLLQPGAMFYWYLGFFETLDGDHIRGSKIRLRRLPPITETELSQARAEGERLGTDLGWR